MQAALAFVCLDDGMAPANVTYCDNNTGAGCADDEFPVMANDPQGNKQCVCLKGC